MNVFQKITATPDELAAALERLPIMTGPWDTAFHRAYCDACAAECCDPDANGAGGCPHQEIRGRVIRWWLAEEVPPGERSL